MSDEVSSSQLSCNFNMDSAISSCVRSVVAAILLEHGVKELEDDACLNMLECIMLKHLMKLAALTQSFAEHSMRSQAHFCDAIMAVAFTGTDIPGLKNYLRGYRFPRILEGVKLVPDQNPASHTPVVFQSGAQQKLPRYIQDYFPPVPNVYTFETTPVQKQNKLDYKQARERIATERRQIEQSLFAFHHRIVGNLDSPFNLTDSSFSLLPATYSLEQPAYISALIPSKSEDRRKEQLTRKEAEHEKRRDAEEDGLRDNSDHHPRKYRRHTVRKEKQKKEPRKVNVGRKPKTPRGKEDSVMEDSNSLNGVFSPVQQ